MNKIKQKSQARRKKNRLRRHKASVLAVSGVLLLLVAVVTVSSISLRAKNKAYIAQEQELQEQIDAEEERSKEIDSLEEYVGTDEYIEQTAKDKLNLVHENEIICKKK